MKRKVSDKLRHQVWIARRCSYLLPAEEVEASEPFAVEPNDILPEGQDITAAVEVLAELPPVDPQPVAQTETSGSGNPVSE